MKIAIMQPYFMPYIGYFQLIHSADVFVLYDDIEYTKKGWINRNRICVNGAPQLFTIPLRKDSDFLNVNERFLAENVCSAISKILRVIKSEYKKAPHFDLYPEILQCFMPQSNLFHFIYSALKIVVKMLEIDTKIVLSSELMLPSSLRGKEKVKEIVKSLNGKTYINAIGGQALYDKEDFKESGIDLFFIKTGDIAYAHNVPFLSIIDVLLYNGVAKTKEFLNYYTLI